MGRILYQGHGSLRIESSAQEVLYIDPFIGKGYDIPADYILITHEHYDHNQINIVSKKEKTIILRPCNMLVNGEYQVKRLGTFLIEAVEAYNAYHNKEECVGYIITVDQKQIYVSGDTSETKMMASFKKREIDIAFYPTDGIYNMDALGASKCAQLVQAKISIPIHSKPDCLYDENITKHFFSNNTLLLKPGEELDF